MAGTGDRITTNPLRQLGAAGQAVWFDYIRSTLMTSGQLSRMIEQDGLRGVTANPAIFEKAITGSTDYTGALEGLAHDATLDAKAIYERLALEDIQKAADIMARVYDTSDRLDGYVSLEVSPALAHDTDGTCAEARRLWHALARPNVMIKVPATPAGIPAIEALISDGINVNVTLIFSRAVYDHVAEAYLRGLERRGAAGHPLDHVASVASFFVSRIDAAVNKLLAEQIASAPEEDARARLQGLQGRVAIANAKLAYQRYREITSSLRWRALAERGARPQRLLWVSTGTKDPHYSDVYYVEALIGPDTVNTVPPATYEAFRDHGRVRVTLDQGFDTARDTMEALEGIGVSFESVTDRLLEAGLNLFSDAFDKLLAVVVASRGEPCRPATGRQSAQLPPPLRTDVDAAIAEWQAQDKVRRLWARDAALWTGTNESEWMGWLAVTADQLAHLDHLRAMAKDARAENFTDAVLLGMGGSSLCPEVLKMTFGRIDGSPELHVLDSTDPAQIRQVEGRIDLARTLFVVSSKSGSTLETNIFKQYFFDRVRTRVGVDKAGSRFIAVTDPGSRLQQIAEGEHFRAVFSGIPSIGGRYSALSNFGLVPAAIIGLDVERLLDRAEEMVHACAACVPVQENPGVVLGLILGLAGSKGRDKVTVITSPGIWDLGAWLEQLLAESTGKQGKGLIPVDGERLAPPDVYGGDRLFVYLRLESAPDPSQDEAVARLEQAGQPVVRIVLRDPYDVGQEFFRWEVATAVAGAVLGINPFDQPDVEASKIVTRKLTEEYEATGSLITESPLAHDNDLALYTDGANGSELTAAAGAGAGPEALLKAHLARLSPGDYFAVLAYVEMNEGHHAELQKLRHTVRDATRVATCLGYGPRFLHSTGQAYKGGPNTGVFLQITCDDVADLPVPGQRYTFGVVKAAQALGDFHVLTDRRRRAVRVHVKGDVRRGLARLREVVEQAVGAASGPARASTVRKAAARRTKRRI